MKPFEIDSMGRLKTGAVPRETSAFRMETKFLQYHQCCGPFTLTLSDLAKLKLDLALGKSLYIKGKSVGNQRL